MARTVPLWRACRHGKIERMRGASWPPGQFMTMRRARSGRIRRKVTMHYPGAAGLEAQVMTINPDWERGDWEEFAR